MGRTEDAARDRSPRTGRRFDDVNGGRSPSRVIPDFVVAPGRPRRPVESELRDDRPALAARPADRGAGRKWKGSSGRTTDRTGLVWFDNEWPVARTGSGQ